MYKSTKNIDNIVEPLEFIDYSTIGIDRGDLKNECIGHVIYYN